ncbi:MAG: hypothetical protein SFU98_09870 [Leptospiraceae bacterium]|nr:hypothetical protein [Leptospiraceae bacterium]
MREYLVKKILGAVVSGVVFALAAISTTLLAVAVTGTVKTWTTGEVLSATDLNTTISSLKTAIEGIPNWTKNGTSATYTDGNVGIGTGNAYRTLHLFASNSPEILLEDGAIGTGTNGRTWRIRSNSTNLSFIRDSFDLSTGSTVMALASGGAVTIPGALSKGSGTFDIAHPDPSMPKESRLRHSFVESPTAGDNIYRWQVKVTSENGKSFVKLPKYWKHLNTNPMVWVSSSEEPAQAYGYVDNKEDRVIIQADKIGTYNVLLLGTRKDSLATNNWKELGMEYIAKKMGEAEKILSYQDKVETGSIPTKSAGNKNDSDQVSKKLTKLEESNHKLENENKKLQSELLSLRNSIVERDTFAMRTEERLKALETMQMPKK